MAEQGSILVFPGGAREVFKRKGEQYRLLWGKRTGFAHLAIEHGYAIVPFSAVGAEDAFDILIDAEELLASPIGPLNPSARSSGRRRRAGRARDRSTMLPRPERFYFRSVGRVRALALREQCKRCRGGGSFQARLFREAAPRNFFSLPEPAHGLTG
jgi:hypothetical protein